MAVAHQFTDGKVPNDTNDIHETKMVDDLTVTRV